MSLLLERRGTDATVTGFNASAAFIGVIAGPMLTPLWVRRLGIRTFLVCSLSADIVVFLSMKVFDGLLAWFVLRILSGLIGSGLFTASEAWINLLAEDEGRGRVIGVYAAALSAGFGLGPLLLTLTGITGWAPFLANAAIVVTAMLPLLAVRDDTASLGRDRITNPLIFFFRARQIVAVVAMFGLFEAAMLALLPVWGVRSGLTTAEASALVSTVYFGAVALQVPIGVLSDRLTRPAALRVCGAVGLVGAVILAGTHASPFVLYPLLFAWGGLALGIYPVALGMAGDRFQGSEMVAVNAAIIAAYGLGALIGPGIGGFAMDLWNPQGFPAMFAVLFAVLLFTSLTAVRK